MTMRYLLLATLLATPVAWSDTAPPPARGARAEIWLAVNSWPSLESVRPVAAGRFDAIGVGLGAAFYVTVRELPNSELLMGADAFIAANESNIEGAFADLSARQAYFGAALKWAIGADRRTSLDAGIGYHLVDMAEVSEAYFGIEREVWEAHRASAYVGGTWDFPRARLDSPGRWMLGFRAHFVDFGTVDGPGPLGADAGKLDGPLYMLQIGYGLR